MGNIGVPGVILLLILALLLFGPNKLPELGRAFGRTLREFKAGARDIMGDEASASDRQSAPAVQVPQQATSSESSRRLPE